MSDVKCIIKPIEPCAEYKYVVCLTKRGGKYLLSRHRSRQTWETQGGHIEPGETPEQAARRELYEESGAADYDMSYLCDYYGYDDDSSAWGAVFAVELRRRDPLPQSEMAEVREFAALPENLTYPGITPALFAEMDKRNSEHA